MEATEGKQATSGENKQGRRKIDKVILDQFWTLAEGTDAERNQAAEKLIQRLVENKTKDPESASSQLDYCLQRLIRGLASNRKFARIGYSAALTKLLRQMKVKVKTVLTLISEELKISGHDQKSDVGSKLLGRVFGYGALIKSEKTLKDSQLETVISELRSLGEKKSYIRPASTQVLLDLIAGVNEDKLTGAVWPLLKADLDKGWEDCPADRLILLLACRDRDPTLVGKAWGSSKILSKKNYENILHLFMRSVDSSQLLPLLVDSVVTQVLQGSSPEQLLEFWTKVGNPLLASTVPRKQLAVTLFCQLLSDVTDLNLVQGMLFPAVATAICKTAEKKEEQLVEVCIKAETLVTEKCSEVKESSIILSIVKGVCQTSLRLKCPLPYKLVSSLVSNLKGESASEFSQLCMDCMFGRGDLISQSEKEEKAEATYIQRFSQQLVPVLRIIALDPTREDKDLPCHILQFLFLHSFFKVVKASKNIPHCQELSPEFHAATRGVCQATLKKMLTQLLSMKPENVKQEEHILRYISILSALARYVQTLLSSPDIAQPVKDITDEVKKEWETIMKSISTKATTKRKSVSAQVGEAETFNLLILHLAFDLFTEPKATVELLQDIYVCQQKATKKKAKKGADGEPEWVEVITEILLSMLSRASKLARKTTVAVFRSLTSHLTPAAVLLVTEVLKKSEKGDLFEFQDDVNGKEDDDDEGSDSDEEKDEEMPTDEESDEEEDEDDAEEVDEELRKSVKAALGAAAVASDEEDEEEEDLSDSEMIKLDDQLAAAFRAMKRPSKKEKKEKRREVASFKLRALDLLEVIVKGERCGDFITELLDPLLTLVMVKSKGNQAKGQNSDVQQLCNRATELFHILCKQRNVVDRIHSQEELAEVASSLLQRAQSVSNHQLAAEMANACLCIMRLMSHEPDSEPSPVKTRSKRESGKKKETAAQDPQAVFVELVRAALEEDIIKRKNCKYNMAFFSAMVQKYPTVFWPLTSTLLASLQNEETKVHTKTQACALFVHFLRLNKRDGLSAEQWKTIFSDLFPVLKKLVLSQKKEALKSGLLLEVLTALHQGALMCTVDERKLVLTGELLTHLGSLKGGLNKDTRKMIHKVMHVTHTADHSKKKGKKRKCENSTSGTVTQNGTD